MAYDTKQITHKQAAEWPQDAEHLPVPSITPRGQEVIHEWIKERARHPDRHSLAAWCSKAEFAAANAGPLVCPSIEMRQFSSCDYLPHVLTLDNHDHFTWSVSVAQS